MDGGRLAGFPTSPLHTPLPLLHDPLGEQEVGSCDEAALPDDQVVVAIYDHLQLWNRVCGWCGTETGYVVDWRD